MKGSLFATVAYYKKKGQDTWLSKTGLLLEGKWSESYLATKP